MRWENLAGSLDAATTRAPTTEPYAATATPHHRQKHRRLSMRRS